MGLRHHCTVPYGPWVMSFCRTVWPMTHGKKVAKGAPLQVGWGVEIRLLWVPQVSDILDIIYTNIIKGNRDSPAPLSCSFYPLPHLDEVSGLWLNVVSPHFAVIIYRLINTYIQAPMPPILISVHTLPLCLGQDPQVDCYLESLPWVVWLIPAAK